MVTDTDLRQWLQNHIGKSRNPEIEIRSLPSLLTRSGDQPRSQRLVPLKCQASYVADDSFQLLLRYVSRQRDSVQPSSAYRGVCQDRIDVVVPFAPTLRQH